MDPRFLDPEYPFEWGGILEAPAGTLTLEAYGNPDPSMTAVIFPATGTDEAVSGHLAIHTLQALI